jgi:hypothetical protein
MPFQQTAPLLPRLQHWGYLVQRMRNFLLSHPALMNLATQQLGRNRGQAQYVSQGVLEAVLRNPHAEAWYLGLEVDYMSNAMVQLLRSR